MTDELLDLLSRVRLLLAEPAFLNWPRRAAAERLTDQIRERLTRPATLAVVGEFSSGKSFLINVLLGELREENGTVRGLLAVDVQPLDRDDHRTRLRTRGARNRALTLPPLRAQPDR